MNFNAAVDAAMSGRPGTGLRLFALLLALLSGTASWADSCATNPVDDQPVDVSLDCGQAPSATWDDTGQLWVVFVQDQHAYVVRSSDSAGSFSSPVKVNAQPEEIEVNGENRPKVLVRDEKILISWTRKTEGRFTGDIRFSRSTDGGRSFSTPLTVNDDGLLTSHRFESIFLTDSDHLYITWLDKRELEKAEQSGQSYEGSAVFYSVSDDFGETFSPNYKVADHSCECCRIAVAAHGEENVAILWRQIFSGNRDHAIAVLSPSGKVEYNARASRDHWQINACPHHGPTMTAGADGAYHLAWFTNSEQRKGIYYGRHLQASGETGRVTEVDGRPGAGHPQIIEFDRNLYLIWKAFDGEQTELRMQRSADYGNSWDSAITLATTDGASDYPLLIKGPTGAFVSWQTEENGYRFLAVPGTAKSGTTGSGEKS